jgi:hypothetical protein
MDQTLSAGTRLWHLPVLTRIQAPSFHTAQFTRSKDFLTRAIPEPFFARPMVTASRLQCYGVILCSGKVAFGLDANQELSKHIYEACGFTCVLGVHFLAIYIHIITRYCSYCLRGWTIAIPKGWIKDSVDNLIGPQRPAFHRMSWTTFSALTSENSKLRLAKVLKSSSKIRRE